MDGFKAGDVVRLKSGSPPMTVTEVATRDGVPRAWVTWFWEGQPKNGHYPTSVLEKDED